MLILVLYILRYVTLYIKIPSEYGSTNKFCLVELLVIPDISILSNMMKPQDKYCQRLIPQN